MVTSEEIFRDAMALPPEARAELTERLVESLAQDISPEIINAQLAEVRRRIAQVESGEAELIPGDEALARVRISSSPRSGRLTIAQRFIAGIRITNRTQSVKRTAESVAR